MPLKHCYERFKYMSAVSKLTKTNNMYDSIQHENIKHSEHDLKDYTKQDVHVQFKKRSKDKEIRVLKKLRDYVGKTHLDEKTTKRFENIMIYIPGGGGFAGDSYSKQKYLRCWAKELCLPIFSIDYRKSPQFKFPIQLNDVINSYLWILTFINLILEVKIKKLILSGDSFGGGIALTLTNWCIENGIR